MVKSTSGVLPAFVAAVCAAAAASPASAQFVGDVFFTEPSVVIAEGGTGHLNLALFAGAKTYGASLATLRFDAAKLQVTDVQPVAAGAVTPTLQWKLLPGELRVLAVNGQSLQAPIGTVALARITVKPLGAAGEQISLSTEVRDALAADRTALRAGTGFAAQISVGVKAPSSEGARALLLPGQDPALERAALAMRPAGHRVTLHTAAGAGRFREVTVQTLDRQAAQRGEAGSAQPAQ